MTHAQVVTKILRHQLRTWEECPLLPGEEWLAKKPRPERINCGECGDFAEALVERLVEKGLNAFVVDAGDYLLDRCRRQVGRHPSHLVRKRGESSLDGVHAWVFVPETGRHYDSEAPLGVRDYLNLPFFTRWLAEHRLERIMSVEEEALSFEACARLWRKGRALIAERRTGSG